jgi:hypothetical protein
VVVLGTEYVIQVKYSKGSMIKFDVLGTLILLYEVPTISVPTLRESDCLSNAEYDKIENKKEEEIKVMVKQQELND